MNLPDRPLSLSPDIERGMYSFRDENGSIRLTRADVEWLLVRRISESSQIYSDRALGRFSGNGTSQENQLSSPLDAMSTVAAMDGALMAAADAEKAIAEARMQAYESQEAVEAWGGDEQEYEEEE